MELVLGATWNPWCVTRLRPSSRCWMPLAGDLVKGFHGWKFFRESFVELEAWVLPIQDFLGTRNELSMSIDCWEFYSHVWCMIYPHAQNVAALSTSHNELQSQAVISARRASWGATTPRRLRGLQAACCPQWPTSQSMVGVVHSRELGMLWLWSEMPAEDGNKMKPLCFRWHFSLWSIGGFHDVPPAIPRMVMWCLTLRPSTTALATWKLFGWESWNLHSEMQMTETGPSITLHDHSLIYSEFSGAEVVERFFSLKRWDLNNWCAAGKLIDLVAPFEDVASWFSILDCCCALTGSVSSQLGGRCRRKFELTQLADTLRDTVWGEGMPRKKSETLWFVGRQEAIAFTKPHAIYTYRQQLQSSCRYQRYQRQVWVWII